MLLYLPVPTSRRELYFFPASVNPPISTATDEMHDFDFIAFI